MKKTLQSFDLSGRKSLIGLAVAAALCGAHSSNAAAAVLVRGTLAGSSFTTPTHTNIGAAAASVYAGAKVCFDWNNNGVCDPGEPFATTTAAGAFSLSSSQSAPLVAEIPTTATNGGQAVTQRLVLRAPYELIAENIKSPLVPATIAVTPMSTEVLRSMEADGLSYATVKDNISERLGVEEAVLLLDPSKVSDPHDRGAILAETNILTNRFGLATKMFDRGDVSSIKQAEQAAMNIEGVPRYDHIFIVMLENKATTSIVNSPYAPNINALMLNANLATNYYATGNPSEPNYTALGGADDFGIGDDDQWNCFASGANAPQDLPLPTSGQPGLASSPFSGLTTSAQISSFCGSSNVNHNIVNTPNLFTAIENAGMKWRTYNESTNPGQDMRTDSVADPAQTAPDHVYAPNSIGGNPTQVGNPTLTLTVGAGLYKTKHNPAMAYQDARLQFDFVSSNRTLGGGQFDPNWQHASKYTIPAAFDVDQFGTDLINGDIGTLNYVIPDQCDDMHSVGISGTDSSTGKTASASDCSGVSGGNHPAPNDQADNILTRGDNYVQYLVNKIEASPVWTNPNKRSAIVVMFDEGNATGGSGNSCCGWNPGNSTVAKPLKLNADGVTYSQDSSVVNYALGNRGHGNSIFAILTNQAAAPKGIHDSDAYSHFSFVRTLQDMFGLSDPKVDSSYMNRSKYTETFIAANIANLPEFAGSADTHFDSVRAMNHQFVIPGGYTEKQSPDEATISAGTQPVGHPAGNAGGTVPAQIGPDASQVNVWALK